MDDNCLVDGIYLLKKFPGKGGWTYTEIPEVLQDKSKPFGWVTVRGAIDDYSFRHFKLMPMGDGRLFFSVKAAIRKKINKKAGDHVHLILYADHRPLSIPLEIQECFKHEDKIVQENFLGLSDGEKKSFIDWIYSAKTSETQVQRITKMLELLSEGLGYKDK